MKSFLWALPLIFLASCQSDGTRSRPANTATNASNPAEAQRPARPALWRVADADTTLYLFGTVHMLPNGVEWMSPIVSGAVGSSQSLVVEVVLDEDRTAASEAMQRLGFGADLPPLVERVPAAMRPKLEDVVRQSGVPAAALNAMKTWAGAVVLSVTLLAKAGANTDNGVENILVQQFRTAGKPVGQLETVDQQLGYFNDLSEAAQVDLLKTTIDDADVVKAFDDMARAWRSGNVATMAKAFDEFSKFPELQKALITGRNERWAGWIRDRLDQPGTVFIAVGTGHLVGKGSVQDQLKALGIATDRVQ